MARPDLADARLEANSLVGPALALLRGKKGKP